MKPVTIFHAGGSLAPEEISEAVAGRGLDVRRRRWRTRDGDWVITDRFVPDMVRPELVICESESDREWIESTRPDLVGDVWVWATTPVDLLVDRYRPATRYRPERIAIVGYNLKFVRPISTHLGRLPDVDVRIAEWPKFAVEGPDTDSVMDWASLIFCEWAGPNAAKASRRRRPDQRLVVRLHRFELERDEWRAIDIERVDKVVAVGEPYRRRILEVTGWPEERVVVIPNLVDRAQLDRPKLPGAQRTIGLLGATPWRKRPDRALDVLEYLLELDAAWRLLIKGPRPDAERWMRLDDFQTARYADLEKRTKSMADHVTWEDASPGVASWFRRVGHVLSPSEDESFHLAPAEGMTSGTIPAIWPWFGADEIYDARWIVENAEQAAAAISRRGPDDSQAAREETTKWDRASILEEWERLLLTPP